MKAARTPPGPAVPTEDRGPPSLPRPFSGRAIAAWCAMAALVVAALCFPLRGGVAHFAAWARGAGALGVLALALAHVACALTLIPAWPLRVVAGFAYGPALGFVVASGSSFAGVMIPFLAGRRLVRARLARRIARDPRLTALDEMIGTGGPWIVFLLRLSPLFPNEVVNYALGATRLRTRDYAVASLLGMLPLTAMYAWAGSLLTRVSDVASGRPVATGAIGQVVWWGGLAATVGVAVACARLARRALDRTLHATASPPRTAATEIAGSPGAPAMGR